MTLTAKQEGFAQAVAGGMTQTDAYRANYNAAGMKSAVIDVKACELMKNGKVKVRVGELKKALESKGLWTRERSVIALANIADGSDTKANEIVAAIKELNAMHGFNAPTKLNVNGSVDMNWSINFVKPDAS
jgi:phage terminase small subunit